MYTMSIHAAAWMLIVFIGYLLVGELYRPGWGMRCGCLGPVHLHVWSHIAVNAGVLAGLLTAATTGEERTSSQGPADPNFG